MRSRAATGLVVASCATAILGTAAVSLAAIDREQQRFEAPVAGARIAPAEHTSNKRSARLARLPAVVAAVKAARRDEPIPSGLVPPIGQLMNIPPRYALPDGCIGSDSSPKTTSKICRAGDRSSPKRIVLMGDSHANMWLPALLEMAWRDHWQVIPLIRLGCLPGWWADDASGGCREWHDWALRRIGQLHPRVTLLGANIGERDSPFTRAGIENVVATAQALKEHGRVVLIGDPEGLDREPIDCVLSRHASMARCTTTWPAASLKAYNDVARAAKHSGAAFLRTRSFVCYRRQCPVVVGRTIAWREAEPHLPHVRGRARKRLPCTLLASSPEEAWVMPAADNSAAGDQGPVRCRDDSLPAHDVPDHRSGEEPRLLRGARLRVPARHGHRARRRDRGDELLLRRPGQEEELELTFNHDGRTDEVGTASGTSRWRWTTSTRRSRNSAAGDRAGAPAVHRPRGRSRLCFVQDPDGYRIELIER